jgi:dienelactone hydrolase
LKFPDFAVSNRLATIAAIFLAAVFAAQTAAAQREFPPPQGKGRIVLVASGMSGPSHYEALCKEIAQLGYDVVLFDGNAMESGSIQVDLVTYPKTDHDFVKDGAHYKADAYADAFERTAAKLKELLGDSTAPAGGQN